MLVEEHSVDSICKLKLYLPLILLTPNNLTLETTLMFSLSIVIFSFRYKPEFFLSNKTAWNLSGLTIILLSLNQWHSYFWVPKCLQGFLQSLQNLTRYYRWRNYEQAHYTGKEKIVEEIIK